MLFCSRLNLAAAMIAQVPVLALAQAPLLGSALVTQMREVTGLVSEFSTTNQRGWQKALEVLRNKTEHERRAILAAAESTNRSLIAQLEHTKQEMIVTARQLVTTGAKTTLLSFAPSSFVGHLIYQYRLPPEQRLSGTKGKLLIGLALSGVAGGGALVFHSMIGLTVSAAELTGLVWTMSRLQYLIKTENEFISQAKAYFGEEGPAVL